MRQRNFDAEAQIEREHAERERQADQRMRNDPALGPLIKRREQAQARSDRDAERAQAALDLIRGNG